MEDRQFEGYQALRDKTEWIIKEYKWSKKDFNEDLTMLEEDIEEEKFK